MMTLPSYDGNRSINPALAGGVFTNNRGSVVRPLLFVIPIFHLVQRVGVKKRKSSVE